MKNPVNILLVIIVVGLLGWMIYQSTGKTADAPPSTPESVNTTGSEIINVSGTDTKLLQTKNNGLLTETGAMLNDLKTGTWVTYHENQRAKTISSYAGGKLNGLHMELSERGMVELQANYSDGFLDGKYTKYKSGSRVIEERNYKMGKLDGVFKKYNDRKNTVQQEIHYKDGLQHGPLRYFDEDGNVTMEYEYKNGEKVSGGIVEKPAAGEN